MKVILPTLLLIGLVSASCSKDPLESLAGCYATDAANPVSLKVGETEGKYDLSLRMNDAWSSPQAMTPISRAELDAMLPPDEDDDPTIRAGLLTSDGTVAIYLLREGATINGETPATPTVGSFYFGSGSISRRECP